MRAFVDRNGKRWDVVLGRESWGALVVLFVPAGRSGDAAPWRSGPEEHPDPRAPSDPSPVRQANFPADGYDIAVVQLDELSNERLQQLLDESLPKE